MDCIPRTVDDLSDEQLDELAVDYCRRTLIHHGLWFTEVQKREGLETAIDCEREAMERFLPIMNRRLGPVFSSMDDDGFLAHAKRLDRDAKLHLLKVISKNWLALDGVWFQAVEGRKGLEAAMASNNAAWESFAFVEARHILRLLGRDVGEGLDSLMESFNFRLYATINRQTAVMIDDRTLEFEMNDCRVQSARKRKGLADYPCKNAGTVEYRRFGEGIDPRLRVECVGCPPDDHPDEWFCKWRYVLGP